MDVLLHLKKLRGTSKEHASKIGVIFKYLKQMEQRQEETELLDEPAQQGQESDRLQGRERAKGSEEVTTARSRRGFHSSAANRPAKVGVAP